MHDRGVLPPLPPMVEPHVRPEREIHMDQPVVPDLYRELPEGDGRCSAAAIAALAALAEAMQVYLDAQIADAKHREELAPLGHPMRSVAFGQKIALIAAAESLAHLTREGVDAVSDRDEWRSEVRRMTELERELAVEEPRRAMGIVGDKEDEK